MPAIATGTFPKTNHQPAPKQVTIWRPISAAPIKTPRAAPAPKYKSFKYKLERPGVKS
jgi:hypothetical protein